MATVKYRIVVSDKLAQEGLERLREEAEVLEIDPRHETEAYDAIIVRGRTRIDQEILNRGQPRLKVITRAGVGVDNIDLAAAKQHGVMVLNTPDAATTAVAELTVGFLCALARPFIPATNSMQRGEWRKSELHGIQLTGKTLGIIGVGRIGRAVAARALGLGMQVLGHDPAHSVQSLQALRIQSVSLEELLSGSHFVSLHVPLTAVTRGMIDRQALSRMRPGTFLINTARGELIEEDALIQALEQGHLAGAALDVFAQEPPPLRNLSGLPNLMMTPHIGAQTMEAQSQTAIDAADETLNALRGGTLRWRVI